MTTASKLTKEGPYGVPFKIFA